MEYFVATVRSVQISRDVKVTLVIDEPTANDMETVKALLDMIGQAVSVHVEPVEYKL